MPTELLHRAYASEDFRQLGHALIDQLADYLARMQDPASDEPAIPYRPPQQALADWTDQLAPAGGGDPLALFERVLQEVVRLHHPRYMGHQVNPPVPVAALMGLVGDFINNGAAVYEMGMASTAAELAVVARVAAAMGFGPAAGGFLTSGGTLANLTALLTARSAKAREGVWEAGMQQPLALMVSEEAHYCVDRAARIMGWGSEGVIKVPCDENYRIRTDLLEDYYQRATAAGRQVIAIVGSACSTATGAFDDLNALADFAARHDLWFHIDGAHGAALAFSDNYRPVVDGMTRADSVIMDFHKMLLSPSITTALIYGRVGDSYRTFQQRATYLLEEAGGEQDPFNMARRTFECTKLSLGLKVYAILHTYGTRLWSDYVTRVCDNGQRLARQVKERSDFELALDPACNIVCFRYRPAGLEAEAALLQLNRAIRQQLLEDGHFYIVSAQLRGRFWLRCTLTNAFTSEREMTALLDEVTRLGHAMATVQS